MGEGTATARGRAQGLTIGAQYRLPREPPSPWAGLPRGSLEDRLGSAVPPPRLLEGLPRGRPLHANPNRVPTLRQPTSYIVGPTPAQGVRPPYVHSGRGGGSLMHGLRVPHPIIRGFGPGPKVPRVRVWVQGHTLEGGYVQRGRLPRGPRGAQGNLAPGPQTPKRGPQNWPWRASSGPAGVAKN